MNTIIQLGWRLGILLSMVSYANAALVSLQRTPYDRQLERVQHILNKEACSNNGHIGDITLINKAMREAYSLPYSTYHEWQSPEETKSNKRADCKGRAVLLHHRLNLAGIGSHRLVIGRVKGGSRESHTWLVWKTQEAEYLLDPTFYRKAVRVDKISKNKYIPEYIYCSGAKYGYIPNSIIYAGLGDVPEEIKQRSSKTRIYLADESEQLKPATVQKSKKISNDLPKITQSKDIDSEVGEDQGLEKPKEVSSKPLDKESAPIGKKIVPADPSVAVVQ